MSPIGPGRRAAALRALCLFCYVVLPGCKNSVPGTSKDAPAAPGGPSRPFPTEDFPRAQGTIAVQPQPSPLPTDGPGVEGAAKPPSSQLPGMPSLGKPSLGKIKRCGEASFYSDSLAGGATASGEPYRPNALTAASLDIALGKRAMVVLKGNEAKKVEVRVNDRGPYAHGRIIDLSRAAFSRLADLGAGVADVCVHWD